jgi:predicted nuclease of predicted toxin-antitoxin system
VKRVVLDQGLAPEAAALLRSSGWDAVHVSEVGLEKADDPDIVDFARRRGAVCITLDSDFHTHLADTEAVGPSVIRLRVEGMRALQQARFIEAVWTACGDAIETGIAVSADEKSVRFRRLPLK